MTSKDLLYALQTRSKKMIRELDAFADGIERVSLEDGWNVVLATLALVRELTPAQDNYRHLLKAVNGAWMAFCERPDEAAGRLYETVVAALERTDWTRPDQAQVAYQLLFAFHENGTRFLAPNEHLRAALRRYTPRLLDLVRALQPYAGQTLFGVPVKPHRGLGADAVEMLLEMFFHHTGIGEDEDLRVQAADLLPQLARSHVDIGNNLTLALLEHHPERAAIVADLIDLYLRAGVHDDLGGMFFSIMLDLVDNSGDSFVYADLDKITKRLALSSAGWSAGQFDTFAHYAFYYRLKSDEDRRLFLMKSKKARRLAALVAESGHDGEYVAPLRALYEAVGQEPPPPKRARAPKRQFADVNLKLLVINELMYVQDALPRFDLEEFVRQTTAREIMIEEEGYAIIPETLEHFADLPIPKALLARVEELGFDGGNEIYRHVYAYWDGEDDSFDPTSIGDLALLPNLKRMSSMPACCVEQHGDALRGMGIAVDGG